MRSRTLAFAITTGSDRTREFEVSDVVVQPLVKRGRTIGLTFRSSRWEQAVDRQWAGGHGKSESFELPPWAGQYLEARDRGEADPVRAPWTGNTLYVLAHGRPHRIVVSLTDGVDVPVDGATFARIVAGTQPFRDAMADRRPDSIVLLSCAAAAVDGPGGAAYEFQRTLASEFGHGQPVTAPTTDVELVTDRPSSELVERVLGLRSRTAVVRGGRWLVFAASPASLLGADRFGHYHRFGPADVRRREIVHGDRKVGVSFGAGAVRLPEDAPAGVFHVDVRAGRRGFDVTAADGSHRAVDGRALARLV
ncbi:translation initiation factor IF-2, partial [Kutzneria sp. 744]